MPSGRNRRGPLPAILKRPDKDAIIADLSIYYLQKENGVMAGEERFTLKAIAEKYRISTASLQAFEGMFAGELEKLQKIAFTVGITQLTLVKHHVDMWDRVCDMADRAKKLDIKDGEIKREFAVLKELMPVVLERMQALVPSEQSDGLTGTNSWTGGQKQAKSAGENSDGPKPIQELVINGMEEADRKRKAGSVVLQERENREEAS